MRSFLDDCIMYRSFKNDTIEAKCCFFAKPDNFITKMFFTIQLGKYISTLSVLATNKKVLVYPTKKETHHLELFNSQEDHK